MPIRIAMPVAHITGAIDYGSYYSPAGDCLIRVADYFNANNCEGIHLERDPAAPATLADETWDLYAFTNGFLSFQDNSLVLRLEHELVAGTNQQEVYRSGQLFRALRPKGPQLRHVVYRFGVAPGAAAVSDKIRIILQDATHPGRQIQRVLPPNAMTPVTLGNYLMADPANLDLIALRFMEGSIELFVRAGDVIGNFKDQSVQLRWIDSCGNPTTNPAPPGGRPLSPAYFLYLVRSATNANRVTMLTALVATQPDPPTTTHPLYFQLDPARLTAAGLNANLGVDLAATLPPPPLHLRVDVRNAADDDIAGYGIPMRGLGEWHESRNAANPFDTQAPVRWRLYGTQEGDTDANDFGRFITEVKAGRANRLPGPDAFDHQFTPEAIHTTRFQSFWDRYGAIFNVVAETYQMPVELIIATACSETSTGAWYNAAFANSHEMDIIRMEPLTSQPAAITADPVQQALLTDYMNLTGGVGGGGANANIPVPWNGAGLVRSTSPLTWNALRDLIETYHENAEVKVSPGVMQTLVGTAMGDLDWGELFYGAGYVHAISIVHDGVNLTADAPPASHDLLFSDWFGVSVDGAGANTTNAAAVHAELTKMKRAMHSIIAGTAHLKRMYNTVGGTLARPSNIVTDFDLPTSFSGFNDGAGRADPATAASTDNVKWQKLFTLIYYDKNYPKNAPCFYNAAVNYFNTTANLNPLPTIRLWRG